MTAAPAAHGALSLKHRLWIGFSLMILFCIPFVFLGPRLLIDSKTLQWAFIPSAFGVGWFIARWIETPFRQSCMTLTTGILGFQDGDFSFRIAPPPQPEIADLIARFNKLGDQLRDERATIYQKELLLDTVIQSAPMAILLVGSHDRIILANTEARKMFPIGKPLTGLAFAELERSAPEALRQALHHHQALITLDAEEDREIFHFSRQRFHLHGISHQLLIIKRLTREMRRQEVVTWKKLIRLMNHELNNALAPLQSLLNSVSKILRDTPQYERAEPLFATMQTTIKHLLHFLQHYAHFARLPKPQPLRQSWSDFFTSLQALMPFELVNDLHQEFGYFDPGQLQQVLINLLKNAREASPQDQTVRVHLRDTADGGAAIRVLDRGKGMLPEHMQKSLLPFYSTKHGGTGLGLAISREILEAHGGHIRLEPREGGGLVVTCTLPPPELSTQA